MIRRFLNGLDPDALLAASLCLGVALCCVGLVLNYL